QVRRAYGEYAANQQERILELHYLELYPERHELHFNDQSVDLTKNETNIIELLIERHPRVAGREDLLEKLWDDQTFVDENTLNVNMTRRRKNMKEFVFNHDVYTVMGN